MRRPFIHYLALLVVVLSALSAFAQFGDIFKGIGRAKQIHEATQPWTPEQEEAIGRASAAKMIHVFGIYDNLAMTSYVNLVGNSVAQFGTRDVQYHFAILDSDIINAFALPGGYIFITRGSLANIRNESEMAGVLAHEVAHVDGRHLERIIREKKITGLAVETGVEAGAAHAPIPGAGLLARFAEYIVTAALTQNYGPDKEKDADKNGTDFAAKAGYDPAGLRNFLQMLNDAAPHSDARFVGMVNGHTHPPLSQRVATLTELTKSYPPQGQTLEARYKKNVNFETAATNTKTENDSEYVPLK